MLRMCKPLPSKTGEIVYDNDPKNLKKLYQKNHFAFRIVSLMIKLRVTADRRSLETTIWLLVDGSILPPDLACLAVALRRRMSGEEKI